MDGPSRGFTADATSHHKQQETAAPPPPAQEQRNVLHQLCSVVPFLAGFLVAVHFAQTTYRARHSPGDLAFVLVAYAVLALLILCLRELDKPPAPVPVSVAVAREWFKLPVWALSTVLSFMFAWRISPLMSPPLSLVIWGLTSFVAAGGFCALFVCDLGGDHRGLETWRELSLEEKV